MANAEFDDMDKQVRFACLLQHFILKRTSLPVYVAKVEINFRTASFLIESLGKAGIEPRNSWSRDNASNRNTTTMAPQIPTSYDPDGQFLW